MESTPSIIARRLREAIGSGRLPPGARLGEAQLARELGVSRGPLREAMQRLTQEGLLVSIRNRGLFVVELTDAGVRDLYLARTAIERAAVGRVLAGDHRAAAGRLLAVTGEMAQAAARGAQEEMGWTDIAFHELIVELAASPRLSRMHATLVTETRMCIHVMQGTYGPGDVDRVAEHRAIAEAIGAGEQALVDVLLVAHMEDALRRLIPVTDLPATPAGGLVNPAS